MESSFLLFKPRYELISQVEGTRCPSRSPYPFFTYARREKHARFLGKTVRWFCRLSQS